MCSFNGGVVCCGNVYGGVFRVIVVWCSMAWCGVLVGCVVSLANIGKRVLSVSVWQE